MLFNKLLKLTADWSTSKKLIIMDIDGCIIDMQDRWNRFSSGVTTYEQYLKEHAIDRPIPAGCLVYSLLLQHAQAQCVFLTSREEKQRAATTAQLDDLFAPVSYELWMRPNNSQQPQADFKIEAILNRGYKPTDVIMAFDDCLDIVQAYRELGIVAYQTAVGH